MYIKEVVDYYQEGQEADILVTDGQFDILCYAQPYSGKYNSNFSLAPLDYSDIMTASKKEYKIDKLDVGYYSYFIRGKLISVEKGLVKIGGLIIEDINIIPKDIKVGDFIEFAVSRMDFIENEIK